MKSVYAFAVLAAFATPSAGLASTLYGADASGSLLYQIDETDGSFTQIGGPNSDRRLGLAWNGDTETMYSVDLFNGGLFTVDLTDGTTTSVGDNAFSMTGLAFSNDFSDLYSLSSNGGALLNVDASDGSATQIGASLGFSMLDLAVSANGTLYGSGNDGIYAIDVTTGVASYAFGTTFFTSIAFDENNTLYGIGLNNDALYTIAFDGTETVIGGDIGSDVRGLAFAISAAGPMPSEVPLPAGLPLLGGGLMLFGMIARRSKRSSTA